MEAFVKMTSDRAQVELHEGDSTRVECPTERLVAERLQPCRRDPQQVLPEMEDDRRHRAQLDDGGERSARVGPAEEGRDDPQVRRRRDRQELGEALHDAEDDGLERTHRGTVTGVLGLLE